MSAKNFFWKFFFQYQEFVLYCIKILLIEKYTYKIFTNRKYLYLEDTFHFVLYFKSKNDWFKRGKLCVRQAIMKINSKSELCILIMMNWNCFILGMFSSNSIIFIVHSVCAANRTFKKIFLVSLVHICKTYHICYLTEKNYCLRWKVNCRKQIFVKYSKGP